MLDGNQKYAQDTRSNEMQSPTGPSYSFLSTKLPLNSFWFLPTRWRDNRFKVLFQLAPFFFFFFKKSTSGNYFKAFSLALCSFKFNSPLPLKYDGIFFGEPEKNLVFYRVGSKDHCQGFYPRSQTKRRRTELDVSRLGPGFGNQETVTFEHHHWCAKILHGRIFKGINIKGGSEGSQGVHVPQRMKTNSSGL